MTDADPYAPGRARPAANPFNFGGKITDPTRFIGRADELRFIFQRMAAPQMTSVGVVGERRIGKSSLLYHVYQTYPQRLADPTRFVVVYVSLQDARARTCAGFVQTIAAELSRACRRRADAAALPAWPQPCDDMIALRQGLTAMLDVRLHCVLCLDEFEAFLELPGQFDDAFFDALRAMLDDQLLMLVVASAQPLNRYGGRYRNVSRFFNLGNTLFLEEFSPEDARQLLAHPAGGDGSPALGVTDQETALELAGRHPYYLQMAAYYLYEAAQNGKDAAWARREYERQAQQVPRQGSWRRWLARLSRIPGTVGWAARWLGHVTDNVFNTMLGIAIIIVAILAALGVIPWREILRLLGLGGGQP